MNTNRTLLVFVVLVVAVMTLVSTGAFTTASAERTADISVVGDSQAVVQLVPYTDESGQQNQLANIVDGKLQMDINVQSEVDSQNVFNITNHGTQPVAVWIVDIDDSEDIAGGTDENNTDSITFHNPTFGGAGSTENGLESVEGKENAVELGVGETLTVSLYIDTTSVEPDEVDVLDAMIIHADANVEGAPGPNDQSGSGDGGAGGSGTVGSPDIHPLPNQQLTIPTAASPKTLQIGNSGSDTLVVSDMRIVGDDADSFAILSGDAPFTLEAGTGVPPTHSTEIAYTGTGHANAQLEIVSNDPDEPTRVVDLKGVGGGNGGNNGDDDDEDEDDD